MNNDQNSMYIFGHTLPYCTVCQTTHPHTSSNLSHHFALRAEDKKGIALGYDSQTPPATCWQHTPFTQQDEILRAVLQRLKGIADSEPALSTQCHPIKLLVGIEFNRFVSDSHKHIQKLRLHIPDALLVQVSLQNVEANSAVLSGATMYQCDIKGAAFPGGFFREANLIDTCAQGVDMYKTCFEGALIACSRFERSMFERSDLTKTAVIATNFQKSNFGYSNLTESVICKTYKQEEIESILFSLAVDAYCAETWPEDAFSFHTVLDPQAIILPDDVMKAIVDASKFMNYLCKVHGNWKARDDLCAIIEKYK